MEDFTKDPEYDPSAEPYEYGSIEYFKILSKLKNNRERYRQEKIKEKEKIAKFSNKFITLDER